LLNKGEKMEGLWPGVAAIVGDCDFWCPDCARAKYGEKRIDDLVWGRQKYKKVLVYRYIGPAKMPQEAVELVNAHGIQNYYDQEALALIYENFPGLVEKVLQEVPKEEALDHEGNPLTVILNGDEDLQGQYCAGGVEVHGEGGYSFSDEDDWDEDDEFEGEDE
jgi:hypothetical protein